MSPVGEAFRSRCRQFPSLINCCTIDWYMEWFAEALNSVSKWFLSNVELGSDEVLLPVASMCGISTLRSHRNRALLPGTAGASTTPKSYLDLDQSVHVFA